MEGVDLPELPNLDRLPQGGNEHRVVFDEALGCVRKYSFGPRHQGFAWIPSTIVSKKGRELSLILATPDEYFERWYLANRYLGLDVRFDGYGVVDGVPVVEISQSYIDGEPALPEEIAEVLEMIGFRELIPDTSGGMKRRGSF